MVSKCGGQRPSGLVYGRRDISLELERARARARPDARQVMTDSTTCIRKSQYRKDKPQHAAYHTHFATMVGFARSDPIIVLMFLDHTCCVVASEREYASIGGGITVGSRWRRVRRTLDEPEYVSLLGDGRRPPRA